jgi:hypothetical protein
MKQFETKARKLKFAALELYEHTKKMHDAMSEATNKFIVVGKNKFKHLFGRNDENFLKSSLKDFLMASIAISVSNVTS